METTKTKTTPYLVLPIMSHDEYCTDITAMAIDLEAELIDRG